jgi:hypothetical protein
VTTVRTRFLVVIMAIGLGLASAPAAFQMFSRAPKGGDMIDEFRPYMTEEQVALFQGYMAEISAADQEIQEVIESQIIDSGALDQAGYDAQFSLVANFGEQWPAIDLDMTDLLDTMETNIDNFEAVDALPPFALFPWFFVLPGLMIAGVAFAAYRVGRKREPTRLVGVLVVLGVGVILAPVFFQMFTRAPLGGEMIDDFRPMMERERVQDVQGYFITMGGAEGQLRNAVVPLAEAEAGLNQADLPAASQFSADWSSIVTDFAPMIATMSDNVDNYEAVDAMPAFGLFPWFFLIPGVLVAGLAWSVRRTGRSDEPDLQGDTHASV